jgi:hypothetical protein
MWITTLLVDKKAPLLEGGGGDRSKASGGVVRVLLVRAPLGSVLRNF